MPTEYPNANAYVRGWTTETTSTGATTGTGSDIVYTYPSGNMRVLSGDYTFGEPRKDNRMVNHRGVRAIQRKPMQFDF